MLRFTLALVVFAALGQTVPTAHADAPSISLGVTARAGGSTLELPVTPSRPAAGCAYDLYAAPDGRELAGASLPSRHRLARLAAATGSTTRRLASLETLKGRGTVTVYFRARIQCRRNSALSELRRISLRPSRTGATSIRRWITTVASRLQERRIAVVPAFTALQFESPVALVSPGRGSNRLFLVEQGGKILSFENTAAVTSSELFLDISDRIARSGELGLLGLAFHPAFATNGQFFINYTETQPEDSSKYRLVISRFTLPSPAAQSAADAQEQRLLVINKPFSNHNGGDLAFGNDGYLYIAVGDGGGGGDPLGSGQDRSSLLGKVLRIDVSTVSQGRAYGIPATNPFAGNSSGFSEEIFAYGLRNPFRMSFDPPTGRLWAGDVGQGAREEINLVTSGGNYGWNVMEGSLCYPPGSSCNSTGLIAPIAEYNHDVGRSVIGGFVYRGGAIPALVGTYLYADFITGTIFGLIYDGRTAQTATLLDTSLLISSFGQDQNKELYLLSYQEGKIYRIAPN